MAISATRIAVDSRRCGECGGCVTVCPENAIFLSVTTLFIDRKLCSLCGNCIEICPIGALELDSDA